MPPVSVSYALATYNVLLVTSVHICMYIVYSSIHPPLFKRLTFHVVIIKRILYDSYIAMLVRYRAIVLSGIDILQTVRYLICNAV